MIFRCNLEAKENKFVAYSPVTVNDVFGGLAERQERIKSISGTAGCGSIRVRELER